MEQRATSNGTNVAIVYRPYSNELSIGYTLNTAYGTRVTMDQGNAISMNVTGNVSAFYFIGDGSQLSNISSNLEDVVQNGNITTGIVQFFNNTTAFVTKSNVGIANISPIHTLDIGANAYIS